MYKTRYADAEKQKKQQQKKPLIVLSLHHMLIFNLYS
jgi:hypothetical protein